MKTHKLLRRLRKAQRVIQQAIEHLEASAAPQVPETEMEKMLHAESERVGKNICSHLQKHNPWMDLIKQETFPENMGEKS